MDLTPIFENINNVVVSCCVHLVELTIKFPFAASFLQDTMSLHIRQLTEVHECQIQLIFRDIEMVFSNGVVNTLYI